MTSSAPPRSVQPRWIFPFQSRSAARQSSSMRRNHGEAGSNAGRMPAASQFSQRPGVNQPLAADHCGKDSGTEIQPAGWIRVREIRTAFQVLLLNGQNLLGRNREVVHRHVMERIRIDGPGRRFDPDMDHRAAEFAAPPRLPVRGEAVPVETGKVSHDSHPFVFHIIPDFVRPVLPSSVVYCCILRSGGPENCRSRRFGSISRKPVPPLSYRYGFPVAGSGGSSGIRRCSFAVPAANSVRPGKARAGRISGNDDGNTRAGNEKYRKRISRRR